MAAVTGGTGRRQLRRRRRRRDRRLLLLGLTAAAVALALLAVAYAVRPWHTIDLRVYHWAGRTALASGHGGVDVYDLANARGLRFAYTPIALLACKAAAALFSLATSRLLLTVATLTALAASIWLMLGVAGMRRGTRRTALTLLLAGCSVWLEPIQQTLSLGQINLLLMALVLADLSIPEGRAGQGLLIGLATGIKLVPGIFIAYLLVTRRFRAAATAAVGFVATVAIGFVLLPAESHRYWLDGDFADSTRVGAAYFVADQSLQGMLVRSMHATTYEVRPYWLAAAALTGAAGLALAAWADRRGDRPAAIVVTAVTGLLVSPISWSHHWAWVVIVAPVLIVARRSLGRVIALATSAGVLALFAAYPMMTSHGRLRPLGVIWSAPHTSHQEFTWRGLQIVAGNLYVWAGLLTLVIVFLRLYGSARRRRRTDAPVTETERPVAAVG